MNQSQEKNPNSFMTASGPDDSEKMIPLGVGDMLNDTGLDPLAGATEGRKLKAGSLVLVVVIVMACGGLWFMKSMSRVNANSGGNSDVEASIEKFINSLSGKSNSTTNAPNKNALNSSDPNVLSVLSSSYTERQIPLEDVQRDPFVIYGEAQAETGPIDTSAASLARRRTERQQDFESAAERFELKSVLMGSKPMANIGGKIVRTGEEIVSLHDNVTFRVGEITKESVTLHGEDPALDLNLTFLVVLKR